MLSNTDRLCLCVQRPIMSHEKRLKTKTVSDFFFHNCHH